MVLKEEDMVVVMVEEVVVLLVMELLVCVSKPVPPGLSFSRWEYVSASIWGEGQISTWLVSLAMVDDDGAPGGVIDDTTPGRDGTTDG